MLSKFLSCAVCSALGLLATAITANAACTGLSGTWYFFALQTRGPGIKTQTESVVTQVNPQKNTMIETFKFTNTNPGYTNSIGDIISCTLKVKSNGSFSGAPCTSTNNSGNVDHSTVSGQLQVSSCNLTGTIQADTLVTIQSGRVNSEGATGVATQASGQVMLFTLSK